MAPRPDCVFDATDGRVDIAAVGEALSEVGYAVLRGLFQDTVVDAALRRVRDMARTPAVAGVPGYYKVDHPKKFIQPFLAGPEFYDLALAEPVIEAVEARLGGDCVLAEGLVKIDDPVGYSYFPLHADFASGWKKSAGDMVTLSAADMQKPVGIGGLLYLHDTASGAFCYCAGTHKMAAPHGQRLKDYPAAEQRAIQQSKERLDGRAGDFVIFDDRGFHGPDQPATAQRTVLLVDYYALAVFGYTQVSPIPIYTGFLKNLSERQKRVLGLSADFMVSPDQYHTTRFRRNSLYPFVRFLIDNAYLGTHLKSRLKHFVRPDANRAP